ncbi:MAG: hypothetical protein E7239_13125 [Sarcina sp.]|nr:hypothetical protein [Sarcina sp.]
MVYYGENLILILHGKLGKTIRNINITLKDAQKELEDGYNSKIDKETAIQTLDDVEKVLNGLAINAQYMADYFNEHGVPSIALSAKSIDDVRSSAKKNLVDGTIKFIFVVDLYNEGVDIPQVNMEGLSC